MKTESQKIRKADLVNLKYTGTLEVHVLKRVKLGSGGD